MEEFKKLSIQEKALKINLKKTIYGSFAEIGAGQEVAANFFKVGGASGTIAKTISAYDMKFSDAIYGQGIRYVSEDKLSKMLDKEYELLLERLPNLADHVRFFAFADTIEILNYDRTNEGHGWIGLRFQTRPHGRPNSCVIHVNLHDNDPVLQQFAVGAVGVNMLYGCMFYSEPEEIMLSLLDNLSTRRLEIDMFRISGHDFDYVDNRLMALKLVKNGLSKAAIFDSGGTVMQPSQVLYKKNVLILRGRFRPVTHVNVDMLLTSRSYFKRDPEVDKKNLVLLAELTLNDLSLEGSVDEKDFLYRANILCSLGQTVLISNYFEYYRLVDYISRITKGAKIGMVLGIIALKKVFEEKTYENLRGGIMQSFGSLFGNNVKLYIYPAVDRVSTELMTLKNFIDQIPPNTQNLFRYLMDNNKLQDIENANIDHLNIISDSVLAMIKNGEEGWETSVPHVVEEAIKTKGLFEYKAPKIKQK